MQEEVVCLQVDNIKNAEQALAYLGNQLVATGAVKDSYVKAINPDILMMQAAGVSQADDVYQVIKAGADGTGCTSGIVKATSPKQMFQDMIAALQKAL